MWYIDKVGFVRLSGYKPGEFVQVPYMYFDSPMRKNIVLYLHLSDSVSGGVVEMKSTNWDEFYRGLLRFTPYGWCPGGYDKGDAMFVAIDKMSLEFLDYVENVTEVGANHNIPVNFLMSLQSGFSFWDSYKSIVDCSSSFVQHGFPLFQVLCFLNKGWYRDKFYLKGRTGDICCVEFSDVSSARAMIAKAAVVGYNPMLREKDSLSHLFR